MITNTFCSLPFKSIFVKPSGKVAPCCISKEFQSNENYNTNSISEVFNSDEYKKLRKDLLSGIKPTMCSICWERESNGLRSFREAWNSELGTNYHIHDDYSVDVNLEYIDVRLSNLCNFKCIMCSHDYSSSHYTEFHKKQNIPKVLKIRESFIEELKPLLSNLKCVYFAGGEPLITPEHYELLNYLHDNNRNIELRYNTNLSTIKYDVTDLISLWKDFKLVSIQISLDGLFEIGESIRVGMDSNKLIANILQLKKYNLNYSISYTIGNYNINNIYNFLKQVYELGLIETEHQLSFNNLVSIPHKFSINRMTSDEKEYTINYLLENIDMIKTDRLKNEIYDLIKTLNSKNNII